MNQTFDGDPVDVHQAQELRQLLSTEIDRVGTFIGKIESSLTNTTSAQDATSLRALSERQSRELSRLSRMTDALNTRFGLERRHG